MYSSGISAAYMIVIPSEKMKLVFSYKFVRFPVAAVLIFAVLTKAYQAAAEPSDGIPWLAMGQVLFESALALLLISEVYPRWTRRAAAAVFTVFFCVAVNLALKSAESCGCFGKIHVDPRITACLDALIVLSLLFSSAEKQIIHPTRKQIGIIAFGIFLTSLLFIPMLLHPSVQRFEHGTVEAAVELPSGFVSAEFQLGYVEAKSVHRFILEIVNPTDENRPLDSIETECECLNVIEKPEYLAPGKSPLTFEFTAPDIVGPYSKTITAVSGSTQWQTRFHARIGTPLSAEPETIVFESKEQTFTIRNDGKVPVRLLYATSPGNICIVKVTPEPIAPGGSITLAASLTGELSDKEHAITIHTNYPRQKILRIPFRKQP